MNLKPLAANMTEVEFSNGHKVLFSYKTPVASYDGHYVVTNKFWSKTTSRHINKWLKSYGVENMAEQPLKESQEYFDTLMIGVEVA